MGQQTVIFLGTGKKKLYLQKQISWLIILKNCVICDTVVCVTHYSAEKQCFNNFLKSIITHMSFTSVLKLQQDCVFHYDHDHDHD